MYLIILQQMQFIFLFMHSTSVCGLDRQHASTVIKNIHFQGSQEWPLLVNTKCGSVDSPSFTSLCIYPTHTFWIENQVLNKAEVNEVLNGRYQIIPRISRHPTWNKESWVSWSILWISSGTVQGLTTSRSLSWSTPSVWTAVATCGGFCFDVLLTLYSAAEEKTSQP